MPNQPEPAPGDPGLAALHDAAVKANDEAVRSQTLTLDRQRDSEARLAALRSGKPLASVGHVEVVGPSPASPAVREREKANAAAKRSTGSKTPKRSKP